MEKAFQDRVEYVAYWVRQYGFHKPHSNASFLIMIGMLETAYFFTEEGLDSTIWEHGRINERG